MANFNLILYKPLNVLKIRISYICMDHKFFISFTVGPRFKTELKVILGLSSL